MANQYQYIFCKFCRKWFVLLGEYLGRKNSKHANCVGIFKMSISSRKVTAVKQAAKIIIASRVLGSINYIVNDAISSVKVAIGWLGQLNINVGESKTFKVCFDFQKYLGQDSRTNSNFIKHKLPLKIKGLLFGIHRYLSLIFCRLFPFQGP